MKNNSGIRHFLPVIIVFILVNSILLTLKSRLSAWDIDRDVAIIGNLVLFFATASSFYFYNRALRNNNVQAFLRMIYVAMFIKMFTCLIAAFIYISMAGKETSKGAVFTFLFLYLVYTFMEVVILMKLSKPSKNA